MLRVIELFAGIGSQTQALKNIEIDHKVIAISEIDKYAVKTYEAIHGKANNLGDITKIEELPEADLWTYSFPCTDISVAGKLGGLEKGSGTRSGLLWEVERLLLRAKEKGRLPKYLLLENVKNLIGKKFKADYEKWLAFLNSLGYHNYWKVLNAKHYGIPQNRERVFCVSCLDEIDYKFPETFSLILRLRDMLEEKVDEKYFISSEKAIAMLNSHFQIRRKSVMGEDAVTPSLMARDHKEPRCVVIGSLDDEKYSKMMECSRRVYDIEGISPTIHTCQGGNTEPKIAAMRGRNPENPSSRVAGEPTEQRLEFNENGTTNAITTVQKDNLVVCEERRDEGIRMFNDGCCGALRTIDACGDKRVMEVGGLYTEDSPRFHRPPLENLSRTLKAGLHDAGVQISEGNIIRIRKLTPTECLRLMGWKDTQIDKIREAGLSGTQMYKQAGNGIVVNVLEAIFKNLLINLGE